MTAPAGDQVYLGSQVMNMHFYGVVQDLDTPSAMTATMEAVADDAVVTMDALVGAPGQPGKNAPLVKLQWDSDVDTPADLPTNLKDTEEDRGKGWWINDPDDPNKAFVYVWDGTRFHAVRPGPAGPTGPVPHITPTVEIISWQDQQNGAESEIIVGGTSADPTWHLKLAAERGPRGENGYISDAGDLEGEPGPGQVLAFDYQAQKWRPTDPNPVAVKMFTVPEAAFQNVPLAVGTKVPIGTYEIPPQEFDYNLWVTGHLRCGGVDGDFDPFQIGCEVRVGEPNADLKGGVLIGRGFGNSSQWLSIVPHASTGTTPNDAISPDGVYGRFAKNTTYRIGVFMFTDGVLGVYTFQRRDAQLAVQVLPIYEPPA